MPPTKENLMHFVSHVKTLTKKDDEGLDGFDTEYKYLSTLQTTLRETIPAEVGRLPENYRKNRYKDIIPYDPHRVVLPVLQGEDGPIEGSDYINASFIKDCHGDVGYIAAMGPMSTTTADFWRMIWHHDVQTVVMVCNEIENGKKKCAPYTVSRDKREVRHGDFIIEFMDDFEHNAAIVSTVVKIKRGDESKIIRHFHFRTWPDHGVPTSSEPIVELIQMIRDHQPRNSPPIVVHCSAGCGRTGTVIAVDYAWQLLENGREKNFYLPDIVAEMRRHRISVVQTKEQYVLIYRSVLKLAKLYMRKKKRHDDHKDPNEAAPPVPAPSQDIYGNLSVTGMEYGQQVLALAPKVGHAPAVPCFTVRVDGRGDAEEADLMDRLNHAAASSSPQVYENDADLQAHEEEDNDERPPCLPVRTAQSNCMEESTYQLPSTLDRPKQKSYTPQEQDREEAPPSIPVRTEDSYRLASSSRSALNLLASSSTDAESSAALAASQSDYSAISECLAQEREPPQRSPITSRRGSAVNSNKRAVPPHDSAKQPPPPNRGSRRGITAINTNQRPGSGVSTPVSDHSTSRPMVDRRDFNKLGLKRVGRPKGPRPRPTHWRTVMM